MHSSHDWATDKCKAITPTTFSVISSLSYLFYSLSSPINTYLRRALHKQSILRGLRPGPILYPLSLSPGHTGRPFECPLSSSGRGSLSLPESRPPALRLSRHHNPITTTEIRRKLWVFCIIFPWVYHGHLYVTIHILHLLSTFSKLSMSFNRKCIIYFISEKFFCEV